MNRHLPPDALPPDAPQIEALLTYLQAGEVLGVTDRTVRNLVSRGRLRAVRFGRNVRVDPEDLRRFIDDAKNGGPEATA